VKIYRFRAPSHSYGYIRANWLERIFLRGRMSGGDSGLYEFEGWEPGPKRYRARFCIQAKRTGYRLALWRRDDKPKHRAAAQEADGK
jgi:hypothetical protein